MLLASALLMALTLYLIYFWVPTELNLGVSRRFFYFHVPRAWLGHDQHICYNAYLVCTC